MSVQREGTECVLHVNSWEGEAWPEPGDFLRTDSGTCYRIEAFLPARFGTAHIGRWRVTRMMKDAVQFGEPGVFRWEFSKR
jgi:hypothetical protein